MKNLPVVALRFQRHLCLGPCLILCAVLFGFASGRLAAQTATNTPPVRVSYQGFLTDGAGVPLGQPSPLNYAVDFRIYSSPNSVPVLWSERQVVTVDKGNFSVVLGEGAPISGENNANLAGVIANSATASERYIGLTVTLSGGTQNTLQPRLRLLATPYAFLATTARAVTDAAGTNRLTWSTTGRGRMEVNGDLNVTTNLSVSGSATVTGPLSVSGVISGNGSGLTGLTLNNLPGIDATKIVSGTLDPSRIPSLDSSKIGSGKLTLDRIPIIPATNIGGPGVIASTYLTNVLSGNRLFADSVGLGLSSGAPASRLQVVSPDLNGTGLRLDNTSAGGNNWLLESEGAGGGADAGRFAVQNITTGKIGLSVGTDGAVNAPNGLKVGGKPPVVNNGSATENLRITRGVVRLVYSGPSVITASIESGSGFSVSTVQNAVVITFTPTFSSAPAVTANATAPAFLYIETNPTASTFQFRLLNELNSPPLPIASGTLYVHFIAVGP